MNGFGAELREKVLKIAVDPIFPSP
jgi:hypothetical protein